MSNRLSSFGTAIKERLHGIDPKETQKKMNSFKDNAQTLITSMSATDKKTKLENTLEKLSIAIDTGSRKEMQKSHKQLKKVVELEIKTEEKKKSKNYSALKKLQNTLNESKNTLKNAKPVALKEIVLSNYNPKYSNTSRLKNDLPLHSEILSNISTANRYPLSGKLLVLFHHVRLNESINDDKKLALWQALMSKDKDSIQTAVNDIYISLRYQPATISSPNENATTFEIAEFAKLISKEISANEEQRISAEIDFKDESYFADRLQLVRNGLITEQILDHIMNLDEAVDSRDEQKILDTLKKVAKEYKKRGKELGKPSHKKDPQIEKQISYYKSASSKTATLASDLKERRSTGDQIMPDRSKSWYDSLKKMADTTEVSAL